MIDPNSNAPPPAPNSAHFGTRELTGAEQDVLRRETRRLVYAWIVSLVVVFGGATLWILLVRPTHAAWIWGIVFGLASLPGKYLIFSGLTPQVPLGPWEIAVLAVLVDTATALTLAVGLGWLMKIGWIARTLKRAHDNAQAVLDGYPRLRRMAFWGVVLFVFLPLPASGSIGGSFVGQFIGLTRTSGAIAVVLAGALVSALFAGLAVFMGARAQEMLRNPWLTAGSVVLFAAFAWIAWLRTKRALQQR
jgi:uncharacterized membrane protein